jgi:hypothetical protein
MNWIERGIMTVELGGLEYGLPWWASWLVLAALLLYAAGCVQMAWECYQENFEPGIGVCLLVILLWPLVLYLARRS